MCSFIDKVLHSVEGINICFVNLLITENFMLIEYIINIYLKTSLFTNKTEETCMKN